MYGLEINQFLKSYKNVNSFINTALVRTHKYVISQSRDSMEFYKLAIHPKWQRIMNYAIILLTNANTRFKFNWNTVQTENDFSTRN